MTAKRRVRGVAAPGPSRPVEHIIRQIPPLPHTPMYVWHKYWARKTWNVVAEYIKTYCPEGGIVLDPFAGSGVVAMEALKSGRKAIVCDLLPISTEIIRLTLKPVDLVKLGQAFERVERRVKSRILGLYETTCRNCRCNFPFTSAVWEKGRCVEIRYEACPRCRDRQEKDCRPNKHDQALLQKIEGMKVKAWYPRNRLYYPDGTPFKEKQQYESLDQLFTKRNLIAPSLADGSDRGRASSRPSGFPEDCLYFNGAFVQQDDRNQQSITHKSSHIIFFNRLDATKLLVRAELYGAKCLGEI